MHTPPPAGDAHAGRTGRVLVLGDNDLAALAIVRSLGRAGLRVHVAAWEVNRVARASRYVSEEQSLCDPALALDDFISQLLRLLDGAGYDLVIPTSDRALVPAMGAWQEINQFTRFAAPHPSAFSIANNKADTVALAQRLEVPVPETRLIQTVAEFRHLQLRLPVVLKPVSSVLPGHAARGLVRIARTPEELERHAANLISQSPVLFQEFCPGRGVGVEVLANAGRLVAAFQHERVHEPPQGGASSYRRSVPLSPDLLEHARKMSEALRWTGPAMFEFKRDPRTGRSVLMEINGRFWGSLALSVKAGVDFPKLLYDLMVRERCDPVFHYRAPYYVRHTCRDFYWFLGNLRAPSGRTDLLTTSAWELAAEVRHIVRGREGYDLESFVDPKPAVVAWSLVVRELAGHAKERILRPVRRRAAQRVVRRMRHRSEKLNVRLASARSVLFVCYGNINRSPVAEQRLRAAVDRRRSLVVGSAGFHPVEGRTTGPISEAVAAALGVDLTNHRSQRIDRLDLQQYDVIIVMETTHLRALARRDPRVRERILLLAAFDNASDEEPEIADPHDKPRETFERTYARIIRCVDNLAALLSGPAPQPVVEGAPSPAGGHQEVQR